MNREILERNVAVLSNISDVASHIIHEIAGNEISNTLGDSKITKSLIYELVQSRIKVNSEKFLKVTPNTEL